MDVQISNGDKWKRHLEISLTSTEFKPHVEKTLRAFQKQVRLDGFRPGKVPMPLVEKLFRDEAKRKTIEELVPHLLADVRTQHHLRTVGPAQLDEVKYDENSGLKLRATVEVEPVAELKTYSGFRLDQVIYEVTDEDVEEVLARLREQHSWLESVESGAQPGHLVTADIQVTDVGGVPLIGRHYKDQRLRIAAPGEDEDDFTPQLIGVKPEETRLVRTTVTGADGTPQEKYYQVTVREVAEVKLPELDDELARTVGNYETLADLRQAIAEDLRAQAERRSREELHDALIEEMLKHNPLELPEGMLAAYTNAYFESLQETLKNVQGLREEDLREEAHKRTTRYLKWRYLREQVAEIEHLLVTEDDMRAHLAAVAAARNEDPQRLINKTLNDEKQREDLRDQLENYKVLTFLAGRMKIEQRRVPYKDRNKSRIITA
ncbi:MAG: trigger factor [candidate division KSB1 bacterium]|nr:trigger factor [candidate division KSB1 bacterium]MDZ7273618.1 trigger factor [candidate division KSB1 bacterium]MDZ7286791.1 trigger factor [candidate division KSB1 bacterium]MDZ7299852.1 trigger factor [candidate division KSB1 bacterium]MDZ7307765.1 trigger factor [candidate division KSB1 bacterium]